MLMVAYDSIAYGSLLLIVAYEMLLFRLPNIIQHEISRFCDSALLRIEIDWVIQKWKTKRINLKPDFTFSCPWNINAKCKMRRPVDFGHMKKWKTARQVGGELGSSDRPSILLYAWLWYTMKDELRAEAYSSILFCFICLLRTTPQIDTLFRFTIKVQNRYTIYRNYAIC